MSVVSAPIARSEDTTPLDTASRVEVTGMAGYRFGGEFDVARTPQNSSVDDDFSYAVALDLRPHDANPYSELDRYELFYSRQPTHIADSSPVGAAAVDIEYLQLGASKDFGEWRRAPAACWPAVPRCFSSSCWRAPRLDSEPCTAEVGSRRADVIPRSNGAWRVAWPKNRAQRTRRQFRCTLRDTRS